MEQEIQEAVWTNSKGDGISILHGRSDLFGGPAIGFCDIVVVLFAYHSVCDCMLCVHK